MTSGQPGAVIVGASVAGIAAAAALRKNGYRDPIRVLDAQPVPPHNKPPLSKQALEPAHDDARLAFRSPPWFHEARIELLLGCRATELDASGMRVAASDGRVLEASDIVLAPGAAPRRLPAADMLPGVHVLRSLPDAVALRAALNAGGRVVIAGCGFIGAEVAAAARKRGLEVTVVESASRPFEALLGDRPGEALTRLHRDNGVRIISGVGVAGVAGGDRAREVLLADGQAVTADIVVLGLGVTPATSWLTGSGLRLGDGIICDRYGRTTVPHVHAAGDAAAWPHPVTGLPRRVEHWTTAQQQGTAVGHNIARPGDPKSVPDVPYFWSDQYGVRIQSLGWLDRPDEIRCVHGSWDADEFVAVYRRGNHLTGALGVGAARQLMPLRLAIERRAAWSEVTGGPRPIGMTA